MDLEKLVEVFVMVSISDIPTIKYWHTLKKGLVQNMIPQKNSEFDLHVLRHW